MERLQYYSLINSADAFHWEKNPTDFMRNRIFEYTDSHIIELFRTDSGRLKDDILSFPALFTVEAPHGVSARVGWIEKIEWKLSDPRLAFKFNDEFRPISQAELKELQWELGIDDFEFYRTHWAIKQADLLKILRNRGFAIPSPSAVAEAKFDIKGTSKALFETAPQQSTIFISYSHADSHHLKRLQIHLAPIKKWARLETWDDTKIIPGDKWREAIRTALENSSAAILLVSADFLASDFISENELPPLLRKAEENGARIIPVIIKPCLFTRHPQLKEFQAVNSPDQALIALDEAGQEATWARVAQTVLDMIEQ